MAEQLIDEGIRQREFPGIVSCSGRPASAPRSPTAPDVWEVIRGLNQARPGKGDPLELLIASSGLREEQIRLSGVGAGGGVEVRAPGARECAGKDPRAEGGQPLVSVGHAEHVPG